MVKPAHQNAARLLLVLGAVPDCLLALCLCGGLFFLRHPDKCDVAEATIVFKALGEAYSTLRDTEKRGEYDRVSMLASASSSSSAFAAPSAPPSAATPVVPPTPDLEVLLAVTLVESFMGCVKSVPVGRNAPCGACVHKSSATATERPHCLNCGDRGSVWSIDTVVVTIEPGMNAGHCIRLARQGNQSPACAPGDVVIRLVDAFPCPASALPPKLANPQIPLTPGTLCLLPLLVLLVSRSL